MNNKLTIKTLLWIMPRLFGGTPGLTKHHSSQST